MYTFALGSYWFNPYLPFGGASCTSIAQRQSYAIVAMAEVAGVKASIVAMLDDFLLVVPREETDTDKVSIRKGQQAGCEFDKLLARLNLPKAPAKDQQAAFSTIWCGVEFFSKKRLLGIPEKKWGALRKWVEEEIPLDSQKGLTFLEAGTLRTALGKFCHAMLIWPAGRPCLYNLWRLLFTASFYDRARTRLSVPRQRLELTLECTEALTRWKQRLQGPAPLRRIVPCNQMVPTKWLILFRYTATSQPLEHRIFIATPLCCWSVAESKARDQKDIPLTCWVSLLLEALQLLDLSNGETEMVLARTNIRKLASTIKADCYVRSRKGARIASEIHDILSRSQTSKGELIPVELRAVLLTLDEDKLSDCVATLMS